MLIDANDAEAVLVPELSAIFPTERERIDRRRQPRDPQVSIGWESIVVQRMADRVKRLYSDLPPESMVSVDSSWENASLRALQRRLLDPESQ